MAVVDQKALCVFTNIVTKHYECIMTHYKCPHNAHRCGLHRKCYHFVKSLLTAYRGYRKAVCVKKKKKSTVKVLNVCSECV